MQERSLEDTKTSSVAEDPTFCNIQLLQEVKEVGVLDELQRAAEDDRPWYRKHNIGGFPLVVLGHVQDQFRVMALCRDNTLQERVVVGVFEHCSTKTIRQYENAVNSNSKWELKLLATARQANISPFDYYMKLAHRVLPHQAQPPQVVAQAVLPTPTPTAQATPQQSTLPQGSPTAPSGFKQAEEDFL